MDPIFVKAEKLVHGGQAIATMKDGRKLFVWNALPGEQVEAVIYRKQKSFSEATATTIIEASADRIEPRDEAYLSTSPWQIMSFAAENKHKAMIVQDAFERENCVVPPFAFRTAEQDFGYRNKMEYSLWGDDQLGIQLALHRRGSHQKIIVDGSSLAMPAIDAAAKQVLKILNAQKVRASDLKTIMIRCSMDGKAVVALFVKTDINISADALLGPDVAGAAVIFSNPKSPASVVTEVLSEEGELLLRDSIQGEQFVYGVTSFFQGNIPAYELALTEIKEAIGSSERVVDFYAGVGSIGLVCDAKHVTLVEIDEGNAMMAAQNLRASGKSGEIIHVASEHALEYITADPLIVDPPRAGLHRKVVDRILEAKPKMVVYLSCNPSTQARDVALLSGAYQARSATAYNFFPRTPHIESLVVLDLKATD